MAFKDIHKLKKINVVAKETINVSYLVIGKDIFALSQYNKLVKEHGEENVRLLSQDPLLRSDLFPKGPTTVRGELNQKIYKEMFHETEIREFAESALFYKDMQWKSFSGRSKSEVLKFDEDFFTGSRIDPDYVSMFKDVDLSDEYLNAINESSYQVKIKAIRRLEEGFVVECINGTEFICKKLYVGLSPFQYLELYENKHELSDKFMQFCESTKTSSALFVRFVFNKKILSDMKETLFIPLSYTHDWGHFLGEFKMVGDTQEIEFMHYMDENSLSEEDVSRIIRLLKKSMEKIFPNFLKFKSEEFIALEQEIGCLKIDDDLFHESLKSGKNETKDLFLLGINAPLSIAHSDKYSFEYSSKDISGLVRGLIGLEYL